MRQSIGVDLVEIKKARSFYARHHRSLADFFSASEIAFLKKSPRPHERLAVLLAAKEAVFKTLSLPWMGHSGFESIRLVPGARGRLGCFFRGRRFELTYGVNKNYAVAQCVGT
jgi:phosphopantetheine--protein transferase-like protein